MSSMLPFDLKKPLFGFNARFPHAKRRIHVFADESGVFFRPKNAPPDWWGGCGDEEMGLKWAVENNAWPLVSRLVSPLLRRDHFYRVFDLPDPRPNHNRMWRIWWRPDEGWVEPLGQPHDRDGAFFYPAPSRLSFLNASGITLKQEFQTQWHDAQSDVRAALPWCDLPIKEREKRAVRWQAGNGAEFWQLLEAALKAASWGEECAASFRYAVVRWTGHQPLHINGVWETSSELQPLLRPLVAALQKNFRSVYDLPHGTRLDWDFAWEKTDDADRSVSSWLEVMPPTAHERLEAALFLREWLTQNAPDLLSDWFPGAV